MGHFCPIDGSRVLNSGGPSFNLRESRDIDFQRRSLRIFKRNGLKLDKDLKFSGLAQNMYVYRMTKSKKISPFRFYAIKF